MFCLNCAADLPDATEFCHNCGMMVATEPAGAPPEELGPEAAATVTPAAPAGPAGLRAVPGSCYNV